MAVAQCCSNQSGDHGYWTCQTNQYGNVEFYYTVNGEDTNQCANQASRPQYVIDNPEAWCPSYPYEGQGQCVCNGCETEYSCKEETSGRPTPCNFDDSGTHHNPDLCSFPFQCCISSNGVSCDEFWINQMGTVNACANDFQRGQYSPGGDGAAEVSYNQNTYTWANGQSPNGVYNGGCIQPTLDSYQNGVELDYIEALLDTEGCTHPGACNYDPVAFIDNGTCWFPAELFIEDGDIPWCEDQYGDVPVDENGVPTLCKQNPFVTYISSESNIVDGVELGPPSGEFDPRLFNDDGDPVHQNSEFACWGGDDWRADGTTDLYEPFYGCWCSDMDYLNGAPNGNSTNHQAMFPQPNFRNDPDATQTESGIWDPNYNDASDWWEDWVYACGEGGTQYSPNDDTDPITYTRSNADMIGPYNPYYFCSDFNWIVDAEDRLTYMNARANNQLTEYDGPYPGTHWTWRQSNPAFQVDEDGQADEDNPPLNPEACTDPNACNYNPYVTLSCFQDPGNGTVVENGCCTYPGPPEEGADFPNRGEFLHIHEQLTEADDLYGVYQCDDIGINGGFPYCANPGNLDIGGASTHYFDDALQEIIYNPSGLAEQCLDTNTEYNSDGQIIRLGSMCAEGESAPDDCNGHEPNYCNTQFVQYGTCDTGEGCDHVLPIVPAYDCNGVCGGTSTYDCSFDEFEDEGTPNYGIGTGWNESACIGPYETPRIVDDLGGCCFRTEMDAVDQCFGTVVLTSCNELIDEVNGGTPNPMTGEIYPTEPTIIQDECGVCGGPGDIYECSQFEGGPNCFNLVPPDPPNGRPVIGVTCDDGSVVCYEELCPRDITKIDIQSLWDSGELPASIEGACVEIDNLVEDPIDSFVINGPSRFRESGTDEPYDTQMTFCTPQHSPHQGWEVIDDLTDPETWVIQAYGVGDTNNQGNFSYNTIYSGQGSYENVLNRLSGEDPISRSGINQFFRPATTNKSDIEGRDLDARPGLGLTYWEDDQPYQTWDELLSSKPHKLPDEFLTTTWAEGVGKTIKPEIMATDNWLSEQWTPDVDARTRESVDLGYNARVTRYYDPELQPIEYELNMAPSEVQLYFYPRRGTILCSGVYSKFDEDGTHPYYTHKQCAEHFTNNEEARHVPPPNALNPYSTRGGGGVLSNIPRRIMGEDRDNNGNQLRQAGVDQYLDDGNFYIAFLDWGDGTKPQYDGIDAPPHQLLSYDNATLLKHNYTSPGVYTISGYMINIMDEDSTPKGCQDTFVRTYSNCDEAYTWPDELAELNDPDSSLWNWRILTFRKFECNIVVNEDPNLVNEFPAVGGSGAITIPQKGTTAIVGGVSDDSMYVSSLKRMAGFVGNNTIIENTFLSSQGDRMLAEKSYALVNPDAVGAEIQKFIGREDKVAWIINEDGNSQPLQLVDNMNDPGPKGFWLGTCRHNYFSGGPIIDMWDRFSGGYVFDTSEDRGSNASTSAAQCIPETLNYNLVYNGYKNESVGELGRHVGYMDIGQVRAFSGVRTIADLLDVPDVAINDERHWSNILPIEESIYNRRGVVIEEGTIVEINEDSAQEYQAENQFGNRRYYPVLPKLNKLGKFDEDLGLQGTVYDDNGNVVSDSPNIQFGQDRGGWLAPDMQAPITKNKLDPKIFDDLIIDLNMEEIDEDVVEDHSGTSNLGIVINDYLMTTQTSFTTSFNKLINKPSVLKIKRATNATRKPF